MTAKTIPDTHTRCGKRRGSKINGKTVPLLGAHHVKTRRPTGLRRHVPSVDFVENGGEMLGGGGGQCLCEREAGLRDAARENGSDVIRIVLISIV